MKLSKLAAVMSIAASSVLLGAGAAGAAPHASGYVCRGGDVPSGTYRAVLVTGVCFLPTGSVTVLGDLVVAPGALLDATNPGPSGLPGALAVHGNVFVGRGAVLFYGCDPAIACPTANTRSVDIVGGNLVGVGALGVVVHSVNIHGSAALFGGGGGPSVELGAGTGACDGSFATNTPAPVPALWKADPALANGEGPGVPLPVYSDFEDNPIGGNLAVVGLRSCWFGAFRNRVGGNVVVAANSMGDPDANEVMTNSIDGSLVCFANDHAIQFGDSGGQSNIVDQFAFGECGFNVMLPNGDGGPITPVSVHPTGPEGGPGDPS